MRKRKLPRSDQEVGPLITGERTLLMAMLERAIRDANNEWGIKKREYEMKEFRQARKWLQLGDEFIRDDIPIPWSYQWVCEHLGIDAESLHAALSHRVLEWKSGASMFIMRRRVSLS